MFLCLSLLTYFISLKSLCKILKPLRVNQHFYSPIRSEIIIHILLLSSVACFPALDTGFMFPTAGTGYMFSRAWHRLHVFPRLTLVSCFPALDTGFPKLSNDYVNSLHIFPRFVPAVGCVAYLYRHRTGHLPYLEFILIGSLYCKFVKLQPKDHI